MKPLLFSIVATILIVLSGCKPTSPSPNNADSKSKTFAVRGILREISSDHRVATIQHENISGYMAAMTMPFNVKEPHELDGIALGSDISFKLVVLSDEHWIENIKFIALRVENQTNLVKVASVNDVTSLASGDAMPDGDLLAENGQIIRFSNFRGKALAFTFFFSRCPLPEYCARMARNFSQAREVLLSDPHGPTNWQFLSVSFDPGFDNPEMLTAYADYARGGTNEDRWLFASMPTNVLANIAPKLGLKVVSEGGSISHNLRTVVLDPQGHIFWQINGNSWTPDQLVDAIRKAAQHSK